MCKISQIRDENQRRNNLSKLTTFHPIFQLPHSALMVTRDGRGGAFSSGAGRGEDENLRGGAKKRGNQLIQKFDKSA